MSGVSRAARLKLIPAKKTPGQARGRSGGVDGAGAVICPASVRERN